MAKAVDYKAFVRGDELAIKNILEKFNVPKECVRQLECVLELLEEHCFLYGSEGLNQKVWEERCNLLKLNSTLRAENKRLKGE